MTIMGRDEITQAALAARSTVSSLSVKFLDVDVTVAPDKQSATADLTVEARRLRTTRTRSCRK